MIVPGTTAIAVSHLIAVLVDGGRTYCEMARETGLHYHTVRRYVLALHNRKLIHIESWKKVSSKGNQSAIWAWGRGVDAKRIPPKTVIEKQREHRARQRSIKTVWMMAA